jgi:hypothetical protein
MNKKRLAIAIVILGLSFLAYGVFNAPITNEDNIREIYACDRLTKEFRATDIYCSDPKHAPEALMNYSNSFVFVGMALVILGSTYTILNSRLINRK